MNEFIEYRNHIYDADNHYIFPLLFFENYINRATTENSKELELIKYIKILKEIEGKSTLTEDDVCELCSVLGNHPYIDRFIVETVLNYFDDDKKILFEKIMKNAISYKSYNPAKLYHIIDLCVECNMDILEDRDILYILENYKQNLDVFSVLMDYMDSFKRDGFKDYLYKLLALEYPDNIKLQILKLLVNLYLTEVDPSYVEKHIRHEKNKIFYDSYTSCINRDLNFKKPGISILQSMFYGDFEDSGKGNNGGLAVLLKDLGDEISKDSKVSFVFTITITEKSNQPFISYYGENHVFIRFPIYLDPSESEPFIKRELFIKRYIAKFLKESGKIHIEICLMKMVI